VFIATKSLVSHLALVQADLSKQSNVKFVELKEPEKVRTSFMDCVGLKRT